jgi:hypothetical protein
MANAQLAAVRVDEDRAFEGMTADAAQDLAEELRAEVDNLRSDNDDLQGQVHLLRGLVEDSEAAHQATKGRLAYVGESLALSRETATLWEDLYHCVEARGRATGLVVAVAVTVAGAAGYLLALAQLGSFLR